MKNFLNESGGVDESFVGAMIESINEGKLESLTIDAEKGSVVPEFFYENDGSVFGLTQEVIEEDGNLFVKIYEIEDVVFESLDTNKIEPTTVIEIDEQEYTLSDELYLTESGEVFVKLVSESDGLEKIEIDGKVYQIVEDEDEADLTAFLAYDEDEDDYTIVEDEDDAEEILFLKEIK